MKVRIMKLHPGAVIPSYAKPGDAGLDLTAISIKETDKYVEYGTGLAVEIPEGYMLMAADKSGVVTSKWACLGAGRTPKAEAFESIVVLGAKIVDEDYQGEIHIHLVNVGNAKVHIKPGMKIAQFILVPVSYEGLEEVPEAKLFSKSSERGEGALGSTGSY